MPFRIDVLDPALTPERQAALVDVLVRVGNIEPELADLVSAMVPGTVAEVASANARNRLVAALAAAGFAVRAGEPGPPVPTAKPAAGRIEPPSPVVQPNVSGGAVRGVVGVLLLIAIMAAAAGMCGPPQETYPNRSDDILEGQADSLEGSMEDYGSMMADTTAMTDTQSLETEEDRLSSAIRDSIEIYSMIDNFRNINDNSDQSEVDEIQSQGTDWMVQSPDGYVNMRRWPSLTSNIIDRVEDGSMLLVKKCNNIDTEGRMWCLVLFDGQEGYIAESYIENN